MNLQPWLPAQDGPEIPVNENFEALSHMAVYAKDATTTTGLTWGYLGGRWGGAVIAAGTLELAASSTLYITASRSTGGVSVSAADTAWQNESGHARIYKLTTGTVTVTGVEDHRAGAHGVHGGGAAPSGGGGSAVVVSEAGISRTATQADVGCYVRFTGAGAKTVTFTLAQSWTSGQEIHITNRAASGLLTLAAGSGITLNPPKGGALVLAKGDAVTVKFVSASEADVMGSTEAAT